MGEPCEIGDIDRVEAAYAALEITRAIDGDRRPLLLMDDYMMLIMSQLLLENLPDHIREGAEELWKMKHGMQTKQRSMEKTE